MFNQKSCKAHTGNIGKYYSFRAAGLDTTKNTGLNENSICPKGFRLSKNTNNTEKNIVSLIAFYYSVALSENSKFTKPPISLQYNGDLREGGPTYRGTDSTNIIGYLYDNSALYINYWGSTFITTRSNANMKGGSLRCVAKNHKRISVVIFTTLTEIHHE